MLRFNRLTAATAVAAAFCMTAASASAVELPRPAGPAAAQAYDADANSAENRRWRHRHRDGIDGGDILAGVLILGGIAAVASAVENNNDRDYPPPPPPPPGGYEGGYDSRGGVSRDYGSSGLDRAADICADAVERTMEPVDRIESVRRGPTGWEVEGTLRDGSGFGCTIGNDGRIEDVRTDGAYSGAAYREGGNPDEAYGEDPYRDESYDDAPYYDDQTSADGQYDDETYARLRDRQGGNEGTGG